MTNKLGNNIYYFSEFPLTQYRDNNGKTDMSKMPESLHFTMKHFVTNRSFNNLFGKEIDIIHKRVDFFKNNKDWYDQKGVPYTLGILVSGSPGSGKTSLIKCIANEMKRHIINIHLNENMTKTQLENLFYNEQIHVTQNGKTETYTIPINKRIFVLEDVDCQCDIILDRGIESTVEQQLMQKNKDLQLEIENLKKALDDVNQGKRVTVNNTNNLNMNNNNNNNNESSNQKITLSFLLNLFDGVLETPGRITFMTTNFINKLDKAFTRPGRIDVISKFGFAEHSQMVSIIEHRYDMKLTEEQVNIIYNLHPCITPAELGRILFENFDDLNGAIASLVSFSNEELLKEQHKLALTNNNINDTNDTNNDTNNNTNDNTNDTNNNTKLYTDLAKATSNSDLFDNTTSTFSNPRFFDMSMSSLEHKNKYSNEITKKRPFNCMDAPSTELDAYKIQNMSFSDF
jgi:hypothetical protein